jgi:hypothetical protein
MCVDFGCLYLLYFLCTRCVVNYKISFIHFLFQIISIHVMWNGSAHLFSGVSILFLLEYSKNTISVWVPIFSLLHSMMDVAGLFFLDMVASHIIIISCCYIITFTGIV